jgi:hypothetical protein
MTTDVTRFEANERVDLQDFLAAVDETLRENSRQAGETFWGDPAKSDRNWVLDGFAISYAISTQLKVELGRAILGQRDGGLIQYGNLTSKGEFERIIDVSTYSNGTYGIYVRFELIDGESESRAFWNPAGSGSEIAQTIPTRRLANWSLRLELSNPGSEWLKIGEATVASGAVTGTTDQRDFYFEGTVNSTYASGWSTDGGGSASDRGTDRSTAGVKDLHTFTQAMRQCIEDIKGRGLRRWWSRDIGGMNIGFDAAPVEDRLAVSDANFWLELIGTVTPTINFDSGDDTFEYNRTLDEFRFVIGSVTQFTVQDGNLIARDDASILGGLCVGYSGTPAADEIRIGDDDCRIMCDGAEAFIFFDETDDDYFSYLRSTNTLGFFIASATIFQATNDGFHVRGNRGLVVGYSGAASDRELSIGAATFALDYNSSNPQLKFSGTNNMISFALATDDFTFTLDGTVEAVLGGSGLNVLGGLRIADSVSVAPTANALEIGSSAGGRAILLRGTNQADLYFRDSRVRLFDDTTTAANINFSVDGNERVRIHDDVCMELVPQASSPTRGALHFGSSGEVDPSSITSGEMWARYDGSFRHLCYNGGDAKQYLDSIRKVLDGDSDAITGTTPETFDESSVPIGYTIRADSLRVGSVIKIRAGGDWTYTSGKTLFLYLKMGSATMAGDGLAVTAVGSWRVEAEFVVRSLGASGSIKPSATWSFGMSGGDKAVAESTAPQTIDTTSHNTITCEAAWSATDNSVYMKTFVVEVQ